MAAFRTAAGESLVEFIHHASQAARGGVLLLEGRGSERESREVSWGEVAGLACRAVAGLAQLSIQPGDRVALAAGNSLEWVVADFALHMLGAVSIPLHVSLTAAQLAWQLRHSGCQLLIAESAVIGKLLDVPVDWKVISLTSVAHSGLPSWAELIAAGNESAGRDIWEATRRSITPQTLASIVYTSGTSSEPRGVLLTQRNLAANALATLSAFGQRDDDLRLNVLPFSHAFGRMSDLYVSLVAGSRLAIAGSRETLLADARQVQPTLLAVVPLLLARLRQAALAQFGASDPAAVQKLLGGRIRGFICGGAALANDLRDYFTAQGTPIYEGYGLTEAAPVVSASSASSQCLGSVGRLLPGTEGVTADDGELLIRGPQVMAGYWRDEAATEETIRDGWLHTGDLGTVDPAGYLHLHGRKKEFIALAGGKKVWPAAIEGLFVGDPLIEQVLVVGEGESSLGALVVLRDRSAADLNSPENQRRMLSHFSERLSGRAAHEQIRRVWILSEPWTAEREELTPKMTLRRTVILQRYNDCVRRMFDR